MEDKLHDSKQQMQDGTPPHQVCTSFKRFAYMMLKSSLLLICIYAGYYICYSFYGSSDYKPSISSQAINLWKCFSDGRIDVINASRFIITDGRQSKKQIHFYI